MKKWITWLLSTVWLTFMPTMFAATAADRLQARLNSFGTYEATFTQQTFQPNGRVLQQGTGLVKIKRPGKFYWVTKQPTEQHLVSDGKMLWIYDVDLAQATSQALSSRTNIDPAALLSGGVTQINRQFNVQLQTANSDESYVLVPKQPDAAGFARMTLRFHQSQLITMTVLNNLSQQSEFQFTHIQLNRPIADSWFDFRPPKGVDVVAQ